MKLVDNKGNEIDKVKIGIMVQNLKKKINKLLVDDIIKYLNLYDTYVAKINTQKAEQAEILMRKAEAIINLRYWDNETKIQS